MPSHTNHGESYLKFPPGGVPGCPERRTGSVVASAALLERCPLTEGEELSVEGRSAPSTTGAGWAAGW